MKMIELIAGIAAGVAGGYYLKDKGEGGAKNSNIKAELDALSDENEKLRKRNKEAERQIEDQLAEIEKLRRAQKTSGDDKDDLEDDLADAKAKIKKLTAQNDELMRKINEYKELCASYEDKLNIR